MVQLIKDAISPTVIDASLADDLDALALSRLPSAFSITISVVIM